MASLQNQKEVAGDRSFTPTPESCLGIMAPEFKIDCKSRDGAPTWPYTARGSYLVEELEEFGAGLVDGTDDGAATLRQPLHQ